VGEGEGKRPLGTPKHRWDINVKMHCKKMGWKDVDCINLAQDTNDEFLCFAFHKIQGVSSLAEELLASQEEPCFL